MGDIYINGSALASGKKVKLNGTDMANVYFNGSLIWTHAQFITATGGTVTTDGDYKIHTFTGSGTFTVTSIGNAAGSTTVDYLVLAGGGAGGCYNGGGGGGAGGYRTSYSTQGGGCAAASAITVSATAYSVVVGAGGLMTSTYCPHPASWYPGSDSSALGITSTGGGGAGGEVWASREHGGAGGSGGGGYGNGGVGVACQGYNGQGGSWTAGGGGAGAVGASDLGGAGLSSSITGSAVTRATGGSGGSHSVHEPANSGNGGDGNMRQGGSGVVIIRYKYQ